MTDELRQEIAAHCVNTISDKMLYKSLVWGELYKAKRQIFGGYRWVLNKSDIDNTARALLLGELNNLPEGISYDIESKKYSGRSSKFGDYSRMNFYTTEELKEMREPTYGGDEFLIVSKENYYINISDSYKINCVKKLSKDKIVIIERDFDTDTIQNADFFCKKILNLHQDILEPLYKNGFVKYYSMEKWGFTDFDHGYPFNAEGMQPLNEEFQMLGLMMALAEYGKKYLQDDEFFVISGNESYNGPYVSYHKSKISTPKLKEW